MKKIAGAILIASIVIIACICGFANKNEGYIDVTPDELERLVEENKQVYAYFYSENCVTCRKIKSNLKELKKENKSLKVYGINVDKYLESSFIEDTTGYKVPKVVEFADGSIYKELEDKTMDSLREFIAVSNSNKERIITGSADNIKGEKNKKAHEKLDIYYFYSTTCSECEKTSKYMDYIEDKYTWVDVKKYNIYKDYNKQYLEAYGKAYKVDKDNIGVVPMVYVRDTYMLDYNTIKAKLEKCIKYDSGNTIHIDYNEVKENSSLDIQSVSIVKVVLSALLNGINPCSIAMLLFLVLLLNNKSSLLLKRGLAFCLGKAIALFLIGTILYKLLKYISSFYIINIVNMLFIVIFIFLAILNLYDFIVIRHNQYGKIKAQLPAGFRRFNHRLMRNVVEKFMKSRWITLACIVLGFIVECTEFLCSGQIYLSTIVTVIQTNSNNMVQAYIYLLVYCIMCVVPLIGIILLMAKGVKEIEVSTFFTEHLDIIKIIYSIVFVVMAVYMTIHII